MRAPLRPLGRGANPVAPPPPEDDPLVELARIVSGRPAAAEPAPRRRASSLADEPGMSEADLARDLEAELLSDLQASLAAVGDAHDRTPDTDDEPTFTDEAYVAEQYRQEPVFDDGPYFDPEPPAAEEPPAGAGSLFVADEEPEDLRPYRPQARQVQPPAPPAPVEPAGEFGHLSLRRNKQRPAPSTGAAYNPRALAPEPIAVAPPPAQWEQPARAPAHEPFEAAARQSFDGPSGESDLRGLDEFDERVRGEPLLGADAEEDFRFAPIVAPEPPRRSRGRLGTVLMGLVAIGVAAAAYFYFQGGDAGTDGPPLILADTSPVRQAPANPTAPEPANAVIARIDPTEAAAPVVLGAGAETPVDPLANTPPPGDGITTLLGDPAAAAAPVDDRRIVRTVVMAPDGTIVNNGAGDPGIAPAAIPATTPATTNTAAATTTTTPATPDPVVTPPAAPDPVTAPAPQATTPVAAAPVAAAGPAATPPAGTGIAPGWYVQMSSQTTEAAALADIQNFRARSPSLLGTQNAVIPTATVGGVLRYRVQFGPAASQAAAQSLCNSIRAAGIAECIVQQN
ncbi:MAG: SPOR domain-containing protein [Bauldia sp.]|nr:SPOR domain-containing protein [Bauldia sp.]